MASSPPRGTSCCALTRAARVETLAITPVGGSVLAEWCLTPLTRLVCLLTLILPLARCSFPKQATMPGASSLSSPLPPSRTLTFACGLALPARAASLNSERVCPCRGALDALGDHRAACARAGVVGPRSVPLERTAARICREAGARVAENVLGGVQVAVDTTLVSPVRADGAPRPGADREPGPDSTPQAPPHLP